MSAESRLDYHRQRARHEFDLGARTRCENASRAHLGLAALHLRRAEEILADPFWPGDQDATDAIPGSGLSSEPSFFILEPTASRSSS